MGSSELKVIAKKALSNKWGLAILVTLIAGLFGGGLNYMGRPELEFNFTDSGLKFNISNIDTYSNFIDLPFLPLLQSLITSLFFILMIIGIIIFIIGGAIELGHISFYLKLLREEDARFEDLFSYMKYVWKALGLRIVVGFFTFLWTLLFIIPGIIAGYRYSMAKYILADNPDIGILEAIEDSKRLMDGNKFDLFILTLSFIGWNILSALTLGISGIYSFPYQNATESAFYIYIKGGYNEANRVYENYESQEFDSRYDN